MDILILCAGYGTRLAPLTDRIPKPLVPVVDKLSIEHQLDHIVNLDREHIFINSHHLSSMLEQFTDDSDLIDHCFVEEDILGTGGPLRRAFLEKNSKELLVMNGDVYHELDIEGFLRRSRESGKEFALLMRDYKKVNSVGLRDNQVVSVKQVYGESEEVDSYGTYTGVSWFNSKALAKISKDHFSIVSFWKDEAAKMNLPYAEVQDETWIDIGTPKGLWDACRHRWQALKMWPVVDWVPLESASPKPTSQGPGLYGQDFNWKTSKIDTV